MRSRLERAETVSKATSRRTISTGVKTAGSDIVEAARAGRADHRQELAARRGVVAEGAEQAARHHRDARLVDAARRHALMRRLDDDGDALGLQHLAQGVGDLRRHLLLDLQALRIDLDEPRQLRDADDAAVRQIGDMRLADDRRDMVLAMRFEADVLQYDHLVIAVDLAEGAMQLLDGVAAVAAEIFLVGAYDAVGRAAQPL